MIALRSFTPGILIEEADVKFGSRTRVEEMISEGKLQERKRGNLTFVYVPSHVISTSEATEEKDEQSRGKRITVGSFEAIRDGLQSHPHGATNRNDINKALKMMKQDRLVVNIFLV